MKSTVTASPTAAISALPPIQCVVVLMLENRSFDHLFGTWPGVSGLNQGPFSNRPNPAATAGAPSNKAISAGQPALFSVAQGQGPSHSLDGTNVQLFTTKVVAPGTPLKPVNNRGFVQNYKTELAVEWSAFALVLKRHADSRSIRFDLAVFELHVEFDDLGNSEVS
jgi:hypothetical protein